MPLQKPLHMPSRQNTHFASSSFNLSSVPNARHNCLLPCKTTLGLYEIPYRKLCCATITVRTSVIALDLQYTGRVSPLHAKHAHGFLHVDWQQKGISPACILLLLRTVGNLRQG